MRVTLKDNDIQRHNVLTDSPAHVPRRVPPTRSTNIVAPYVVLKCVVGARDSGKYRKRRFESPVQPDTANCVSAGRQDTLFV